jgi:Transposase DDE domain group 1
MFVTMQTSQPAPGTQKVRRDSLGGKRGDGNTRSARVRRPDPHKIHNGRPDPGLSGCGGLARFGAFARDLGVDAELRRLFFGLKAGPLVVYPMEAQLRLLLDVAVVGEPRVFGVEALACDPLFVHMAGGVVPSIDTIYRDLRRFDAESVFALEGMMARHGLAPLADKTRPVVHLDVDTTVETVFGQQEEALPGYNPRYPGRPSYHPILAQCAETGTVVGAKLRPGNTAFGADDASTVGYWLDRMKATASTKTSVRVRIDSAGDCAQLMKAVATRGAEFVTKARATEDLASAVARVLPACWRTIDEDADHKPTLQVAEVDFERDEWNKAELAVRVIAVRSKERYSSKQLYLWADQEWGAQVYLTSDMDSDAEDLVREYNDRASIEPLIAELKGAWGIGKVPSACFEANHAALLIKLLAHNLLRAYVLTWAPALEAWRTPWIRRALILVPGRFGRSGRSPCLRLAPRPCLIN